MLDSEVNKIKNHLRPIYTEAGYDRTVKMMNALLDVAGDDEYHPLSGMIELAADLVSDYEQEHYSETVVCPKKLATQPLLKISIFI